MTAIPRLLVIAGSDSSAGAGLQADLKTAQAFGVYAQTAVTAVTAQTTEGVTSIFPLPPDLVRAQIQAALSDIGADAIKLGMLGNGAIARAVAEALEKVSLPLVIDPVLVSTSGTVLLDEAGVEILKTRLLPRASLVTPNVPEAEALTGIRPATPDETMRAARRLFEAGSAAVLFKGGHGSGKEVTDVLVERASGLISVFESPRQRSRHTHGTGCTLATAIACGLAQGAPLPEAVGKAHDYVQAAIRTAPGLGRGHGPLGHQALSSSG